MSARIVFTVCISLIVTLSCTDDDSPINTPTPGKAPVRIEPADGSTVSHPVLFYWSSETDYASFIIRVASNQQLTDDVITLSNPGSSDEVLRDTLAAGQYFWKVGGVTGSDTVWSDVGNFFYEPPFDARQFSSCCIELGGFAFEVEKFAVSWTRDSGPDTSITTSLSTDYLGWYENCCHDDGGTTYRGFVGIYHPDMEPLQVHADLRVYFNSAGRVIDSLRYTFEYLDAVFGNTTSSQLIRFEMAGAGVLAPVSDGVYRIEGEQQLSAFFHTLWEYEDYSYVSMPLGSGDRHTSVTQRIIYSESAYIQLQFQE
ncbi:MAG: hypothetical protein C0600_00375 [Ignavibacteria bacterium]|nr:MAG: hypothetical protein C0600_00375 [Ignavibacteria bacterium]